MATLIMKYLSDKGYLDGTTLFNLSNIMDNCFGQNKNNYVLRLPAYLTMDKYFKTVQIIFLAAGYTKNTADRLFNVLKLDYRKENIFSLSKLFQVCNQNEYVTTHKVDWKVFDNWNEYCDIYFKKLEAIKKYQIFTSFRQPSFHGIPCIGMIQCYKSNLDGVVLT